MQTNVQRSYKDGLFYISDIYKGYVAKHELNIYGSRRIDLPNPNYIVFYNGTTKEPDFQTLRLSDSFVKQDWEESCLECTATIININLGHNLPLMNACRELYEYVYLIEQVRIGTRAGLTLPDAIDQAVVHCIDHNILKSFLSQHRAEVTSMILKEFDLNKHIESEKAYSREMERKLLLLLMQKLLADNRMDDLTKISSDPKLLEQLLREYNLSD